MATRPRRYEKIYMEQKRFDYFPKQFVWRGQQYDVHAVERCWTVLGRLRKVQKLCFRVRCAPRKRQGGSTVELYQDLKNNSWHIERVVSNA